MLWSLIPSLFSSSCAALWILPAAWLLNTTSLLTGWTYALSATWLPTTAWAPGRGSVTVLCPAATFQRYCLGKMGFRGLSGKRLSNLCEKSQWFWGKQGCSWLTLQDWHRLLQADLSVWSYHESTFMLKFLQGWIISRLLKKLDLACSRGNVPLHEVLNGMQNCKSFQRSLWVLSFT